MPLICLALLVTLSLSLTAARYASEHLGDYGKRHQCLKQLQLSLKRLDVGWQLAEARCGHRPSEGPFQRVYFYLRQAQYFLYDSPFHAVLAPLGKKDVKHATVALIVLASFVIGVTVDSLSLLRRKQKIKNQRQ